MIEVAIRSSKHEAYVGHRDTFPSKLSNRVSYLLEIISLPGPLFCHRKLAVSVIERYMATKELRNMMAHGWMTVLPNWGATFHFYQAKSGTEITYKTRRFTEDEMRLLAERGTRFSRAVRHLLAQLNARDLLPIDTD
ncbi:MAG TPA: hypothetical protein VM657_13745 [Sphingomonas sp.]|nr:hypothetical protein [Sphingomonas sp.]